MPAVLEARTMLCAVPLDVSRGESKGVWLQRAARLLAISAAKAKRIYYGEVKRIDADTFERMRAAFQSLKAQADDNQARLNELIYLRAELRSGGSRAVAGSGHQGAGDRNRTQATSGSGFQKNRSSIATVRGN